MGGHRRSDFVAAISALLLGCGGTSVGNPPGASVKLGVVGTASPTQEASQPLDVVVDVGGGVMIEEAWVALREIDLRASGTCEGSSVDHDVPGPIAVDLLTGSLYPEAPVWDRAPDEAYCEFRTRVETLEAPIESAPEELVGYGVYIWGTRADGTPFVAQVKVADMVRIKGKKGPEIRLGEGLVGILLAFDLSTWFDVPMLDAAAPTGGVIEISKDSNAELEKSLRKTIPASSRLFDDANRDGRLNKGESEL
jgi:hypothetical protein